MAKSSKKWIFLFTALLVLSGACIKPPVHTTVATYEGYRLDEVWNAALRALHDIDFMPYEIDRHSGIITAQSGRLYIPDTQPHISLIITREYGKVYVDCKVRQYDQYVDVFGLNKKISRSFYSALSERLRRLGD